VLTAASVSITPATPAAAKASFDAGSIITDPLFYDYGTMSANDIQHFLNKQVKKCSSKSQAKCLRDYKVTTYTIKAIPGRCDNTITGKKNQTAAQIIYAVARACEVNPRVLLVTLQKEQGLVTAKSVPSAKYKIAAGYACPDHSGCVKKYQGFAKQVYWAARAFNAYSNFPSNFRFQPGRTLDIAYSPKSNCYSKKDVYLKNRATAALYNYTPYTPNAKSLAHPYKTGDRCSSYGNRNFFLYYNKWFGDSSLGQYLVKSGSYTYLVTEKVRLNTDDAHPTFTPAARWKLASGSSVLSKTLAPLGKRGKVTSTYLKGLVNNDSLTPIVKTGSVTAPRYYLLSGSVRYSLTDCAAVTNLGFSCTVPALPEKLVAKFSPRADLAGSANVLVKTSSGDLFVLGGGQRRAVASEADGAAAGVSQAKPVPVDAVVIKKIPLGTAIPAAPAG